MKKKALNVLKILFFLGLGLTLAWMALPKTEKERSDIITSIEKANYLWLLLSVFISGMSHYFRAVRWKLLLEPLHHKPKTSNTFFAVMVGYLANFAIHRIGEVTRCGLLSKYENVPFTEGFGSVIAERAFDMVCLIIIFFLVFSFEFGKISGIANDLIFTTVTNKWHSLMEHHTLLIILGVIALMAVAGFFYFRKKIQNLLSGKIKGFIVGIWEGLISIKNVNKPLLFIVYTILIWIMYILQV